MCLRILASSFLLALLPGCTESGYLVTSLAGDPATTGPSTTQVTGLRYTSHPPAATVAETVPLRITGSFSPGDRAKILRAVNEWNVALNGFVRFAIIDDSVAPTTNSRQPRPWTIMAAQGVGPRVAPSPTIALAQTQAVPGAGGLDDRPS